MTHPQAVLLDVGGIFLAPLHDRIMGAFERGGYPVAADVLDHAHYAGAAAFPMRDELDWPGSWRMYLDAYIAHCKTPEDLRADVHEHLDSEFADAALWYRELPGAREGLLALAATGVRLGIVSNADGMIGQRLAELEILQVGPGVGVEVECVIDSGAVGVMKPDPRIFQIALDAMGLEPDDVWYVGDMPGIDVVGARAARIRPFVMDPFALHRNADYNRTGSLAELAALVIASRRPHRAQ
jgi:FMN phosphatase YigB (HAD superfamily)